MHVDEVRKRQQTYKLHMVKKHGSTRLSTFIRFLKLTGKAWKILKCLTYPQNLSVDNFRRLKGQESATKIVGPEATSILRFVPSPHLQSENGYLHSIARRHRFDPCKTGVCWVGRRVIRR